MKRFALLSGVALLCAPVWGHAAEGADATADAPDATVIPEITVTAQKRAESLQKSSLSIQVLSADDIQRAALSRPQDLGQIAPGLQVGMGGASTQIYIRGVGDYSAAAFNNPGVSYNVDGVVNGRPEGIGMDFFDLERIEVLKGPQGTLYGRNSTGGSINVITRKPDFSGTSGYLNAVVGNYNLLQTSGALNLVLSEQAALRISGDAVRRDGYLTDGTNDDKRNSVRAILALKPSERLSLTLTGSYSHLFGKGSGYVVNPPIPGGSKYLGVGDPVAVAWLSSVPGLGPLLAMPFATFDPQIDKKSFAVSAELAYDMDWATLKIIPSYRRLKYYENNYVGYLNEQWTTAKQTTGEIQLGHNSDALKWVAGLFFFRENAPTHTHIWFGPPQEINAFDDSPNRSTSYAGYAQATASVMTDLRVILGARYTSDRRELGGHTITDFLDFPTFFGSGGTTIAFNRSIANFGGKKTFNSFTWKAGLEYDLAPQNMLYATVSTGFKAGGINADSISSPFTPEKLTAFEIGSRNRFLGNRLQVNLSAFYWDYKDHQESFITRDVDANVNFLTQNAGKAELYGFNADILAKVSGHDTLQASVEYNHSKYKDFVLGYATGFVTQGVNTGCSVGTPGPVFTYVDCSGFPLTQAPRWSGSASWQHDIELPGGATLAAKGSVEFASSRYGNSTFLSQAKLPSYALENIDLTYTSADGNWSLSGFVRNISDKAVYTGAQIHSFIAPYSPVTAGQPRTYGARASVKF